jgi:hypothetical protein
LDVRLRDRRAPVDWVRAPDDPFVLAADDFFAADLDGACDRLFDRSP